MGSKNILVFAGAGASKAVSPEAYPTTVEFLKALPEPITKERAYQAALTYLKATVGGERFDIEQILWAFSEWTDFVNKLEGSPGFPAWLIAENRIADVTQSTMDWRGPTGNAKELAVRIRQIANQINSRVFESYRRPPSEAELANSWLPLLNALTRDGSKVEVFTTNYDLVLEHAIEIGKLPINTGRRGTILPQLHVDLWNPAVGIDDSRGLLTKLHGSVDWGRIGEVIHVGTPAQQRDHVIIFPGYKGVPVAPPFDWFHQHFERCVSTAEAMLFVGFAFRDEHINDVLRRRRPRESRVVIINPTEDIPDLPFESGTFVHLQAGLDPESGFDAATLILNPHLERLPPDWSDITQSQ